MKLLTWMHRKFRQGSMETSKEFPLGHPLLDDHQVHQMHSHGNGTLRHVHRESQARKSFTSLGTTRMEALQEKGSSDFSEYFEGFLAIGTLGMDAIHSEPDTPTFTVSFERLAEEETDVTENELRLINDQLEKVLAAEAKEDGWTDSSGRNSHVSNGRISHASTITLSGKTLEISESTGNGNTNCPLQEFLLGSAVELPEKASSPKKENRTSLGDLLERQKAEEVSEAKCKRGEKKDEREGDKTTMNIMKKLLKKKSLHASSRSSSATTRGGNEFTTAETKLCKILHKFHKKVHPEYLTSTQKSEKSRKSVIKNIIPCTGDHYKDEQTYPNGTITAYSQKSLQKDHARHVRDCLNSTHFRVGVSDSNGNRECWIKTDADYLVLEL